MCYGWELHRLFLRQDRVNCRNGWFYFKSVLRIRDVYSGSRIRISPCRIPDLKDPGFGSASKNLSIFNPKTSFYDLGNVIRDVNPGSRIKIRIFSHPGSRIQGSKRHRIPDPDQQHCFKQSNCFYLHILVLSLPHIPVNFAKMYIQYTLVLFLH